MLRPPLLAQEDIVRRLEDAGWCTAAWGDEDEETLLRHANNDMFVRACKSESVRVR